MNMQRKLCCYCHTAMKVLFILLNLHIVEGIKNVSINFTTDVKYQCIGSWLPSEPKICTICELKLTKPVFHNVKLSCTEKEMINITKATYDVQSNWDWCEIKPLCEKNHGLKKLPCKQQDDSCQHGVDCNKVNKIFKCNKNIEQVEQKTCELDKKVFEKWKKMCASTFSCSIQVSSKAFDNTSCPCSQKQSCDGKQSFSECRSRSISISYSCEKKLSDDHDISDNGRINSSTITGIIIGAVIGGVVVVVVFIGIVVACIYCRRSHRKYKAATNCDADVPDELIHLNETDNIAHQPNNNVKDEITKNDYSDEQVRLKSFKDKNWTSKEVKPKDLAVAGLYYTGEGDRCKCFKCGQVIHSWTDGDKPMMEHFGASPQCPYLRALGRNDGFLLKSYDNGWTNKAIKPMDLAMAKLYYTGAGDTCLCFICGKKIDNWKDGDLPVMKHYKMSPQCSFVKNYFKTESHRTKTFPTDWSEKANVPSMESLVKNGFLFVGPDGNDKEWDKVACVYCDGRLHTWAKGDDPVKEHSRAFPFCSNNKDR